MAARPVRHTTLSAILLAVVALVAAAAVAAAPASANPTSDTYFYISSFGPTYTTGHYFGEYGAGPNGIATDSAGNLYVTIPRGFVKYYASGTVACVYTGDNGYTAGSSYGLDVDSSGNVYYADRTNHCIAKLHPYDYGVQGNVYNLVSLTGKNGADWLSVPGGGGDANIGTGDGEFNFPNDVAVDGHYLYVTDMLNHRVQKFETATSDNTLSFVAKWGKTGGGSGSGDGEFNKPRGIAADGHGHIFVSEETNRRAQELTTSGAFVTKWGVTSPSTDPLYFKGITGIDVDAQGNVYVTDCDTTTSWVDKFRPFGATYALVTRIGSWGTADAQFQFPWSSAVDPHGYLWVTDTQNNKVKKFARDATPPDATVSGIPMSWTRFDVNVTIGATDPTVAGQYTSGVGSREYSLTGAAPWTTYAAPFAVTAEGDTAVTYRATDVVGNASTPATVHVFVDKTAPTTDVSGVPGGWGKTAVTATLTPSDVGPGIATSGVATTEYSTSGGVFWTAGTSIPISDQGTTTLQFRSTDNAGNVESTKTALVHIDGVAPTTVISGIPSSGWSKTPVTATFTPSDATSNVATTEYSTNGGGTWVTGLSASISKLGPTTLQYRSIDNAGNVEAFKTRAIGVDPVKPTPKAVAGKKVKKGKKVTLTYRVNDVACPYAKVTIKIYKGKAMRKTLSLGREATGTNLKYSYKCTLAKGKYTWKVYATDLAGNTQAKPGSRSLVVK